MLWEEKIKVTVPLLRPAFATSAHYLLCLSELKLIECMDCKQACGCYKQHCRATWIETIVRDDGLTLLTLQT